MATLAHPQQNPLDLNVVGTRKGPWLIRVNAVMAEEESENVALQLVLHSLDEEHPTESGVSTLYCRDRIWRFPNSGW